MIVWDAQVRPCKLCCNVTVAEAQTINGLHPWDISRGDRLFDFLKVIAAAFHFEQIRQNETMDKDEFRKKVKNELKKLDKMQTVHCTGYCQRL